MLCENCIRSSLLKLAQSDQTINISTTEKLLAAAWDASGVDFPNIHGRTLLQNALLEPLTIQVVFRRELRPNAVVPHGIEHASEPVETSADRGPVDQKGVSRGDPSGVVVDPLVERVVRAIDRQERGHDFLWAGYVVKDLLPRHGLDERESQVLFDDMRNEGLILLTKRPSPKNPEFDSTCVQLNRAHPAVRRVLQIGEAAKDFEPIPIRGEPASVTLIRERR